MKRRTYYMHMLDDIPAGLFGGRAVCYTWKRVPLAKSLKQIRREQAISPNARHLPGDGTGWHTYPLPDNVLCDTRMHLTREQVAELLPLLQRFVDTGEISEGHTDCHSIRKD